MIYSQDKKDQIEAEQKRRTITILLIIFVLAIAGGVLLRFLPGAPDQASRLPSESRLAGDIRLKADQSSLHDHVMVEVRGDDVPEALQSQLGEQGDVLMLINGEVEAGFDLSNLADKDVTIEDTLVKLNLPPASILSAHVDPELTSIVTYQEGTFAHNRVTLAAAERKWAEDTLSQAAIEDGLLELATQFGRASYENYLRSLGFTQVKISVQTP